MKTSMTPAAVHKQYTEGISAFQRHISGPDVRLGVAREADAFFRRCALGVWQADGAPITPVHVEYYGAIYTQGNKVPTELFWELSTMVSEYDGFTPPAFFKKMLEYDELFNKGLSRRFIDLMTLMLLLFAAVDDTVSEKEAAFVNACADTLSALCDKAGLPGGEKSVKATDFVSKVRPQPPRPEPRPKRKPRPRKLPNPKSVWKSCWQSWTSCAVWRRSRPM